MTFEPPQKGNPHQLTVKQHIVSAAHIKRFAVSQEVEVALPKYGRKFRAAPDNQVFGAKRVWDQKTESLRMKRIEDDFQRELTSIDLFGAVSDHGAISRYFVLWNYRANAAFAEQEGIELVDSEGTELTKPEEEILESKGVIFVRKGGIVPARFNHGIQLMKTLKAHAKRIRSTEWNLVESNTDLLVGDTPVAPVIPIANRCALVAGSARPTVDFSVINRRMKSEAQKWYFRSPSDES